MSRTLHPHLKRGLDYADLHIDPRAIIEDLPRAYEGSSEQEAKRRRVEKIAAQYLQGHRPILLSAGLRGPFNKGWKNPWAVEKAKKSKRRSSEKEIRTGSHRTSASAKNVAKRIESTDSKRRTRSTARKRSDAIPIASPEASRAVEEHSESIQESYTLTEIEIPPPTAPLHEEHDTSGATHFLSVGTEKCVQNRTPLTDSFWLRRPDSGENLDMRKSTNGTTEVSPTRSRGALLQVDRRRTLQLAIPKVPVGLRAPLAESDLPDNVRSSASVPMDISSPMKPVARVEREKACSPEPQRYVGRNTPIETTRSKSELQSAQAQSATISMVSPTAPEGLPMDVAASSGMNIIKPASHQNASLREVQERPTHEDILHTEECLVGLLPTSSPSGSQAKQSTEEPKHDAVRQLPHLNCVASPAPKSSTGFVYKKVGSTKWSFSNAPRSKPRAVNFNSSPANKKDAAITSQTNSQKTKATQGTVASRTSPPSVAGQAEPEDDADSPATQEQQSLRSSHASRQSAMSTQAAMLLAQREFQESTFPTSSSETHRPWSQVEGNTPRRVLPELSPAITPLSVFRPQMEQSLPLTSVLCGPPVSTQDLFAAASPFAFSTVKKKPEAPQRSNLRMAMMPLDRHGSGSDMSPDSPAYTERVSLTGKNTTPSPWNFSFEKGPHISHESLNGNARGSTSVADLPQLDFRTSVDDYSFNGALHFADRLLCNLGDT
jgi:hypothetical protein